MTTFHLVPGNSFVYYLTDWALICSVISAALLSYDSKYGLKTRVHFWVGSTFCINCVVVVLYWQLFFKDPTLLFGKHSHLPWYRDDYLHLLGPMLQSIDALFIYRAFDLQKPLTLGLYYIASGAYVVCAETIFGLPYPFMSQLSFWERVTFYEQGLVIGSIAFIIGCLVSHFTHDKIQASPPLTTAN